MRLPLRMSLAVALGLAGAASGAAQISTLDSSGVHPSVAIGADGLGLISYYRGSGELTVAHCDNVVCSTATISSHPSASRGGWSTSVTIGADGLGLIAYSDGAMLEPDDELRVAHCDDAVCSSLTTFTLDSSNNIGEVSVTIGADGLGLIAYVESNSLKVAHCNDAVCSSATIATLDSHGSFPSVAIGADGLGLISYGCLDVAHCDNVVCSSATISTIDGPGCGGSWSSVAIGADGLGLISYYAGWTIGLKVAHCDNVVCSGATTSTIDSPGTVGIYTSLAIGADGLGLISYSSFPMELGRLRVAHCGDAICSSATASTIDSGGSTGVDSSVAIGADGLGLIAHTSWRMGLKVAHCQNTFCGPEADLSITKTNEQTTFVPGLPVGYAIGVSNSGPSAVTGAAVTDAVPTAITGATWTCLGADGGSCTASGSGNIADTADLPGGGAVTYTLTGTVSPSATGSLSNTATVAAPSGVVDTNLTNNSDTDTDAIRPRLSVDDVSLAEGDFGTADAVFTVTLVPTTPVPVAVSYSTVRGSATPTVDYTPTSNLLTFSPGETSKPISVPIVGDTFPEPHEMYHVHLHSPTDAAIADGQGVGTILDDDGGGGAGFGLPAELVSGFEQVRSLAALPGPLPAEHLYLLEQRPYSSYEVVLDEISGDVQPLGVDRLDADGTTVLQSTQAVSGVGTSLSLRWSNTTSSVVADHSLRIRSGGCTTDCDLNDTFRIRFYETTGSIPRFNNAGTQVTVLILQNPTDETLAGTIYFWDYGGSLLSGRIFDLLAKQTLVLNTAKMPGVSEQSGAITIAHDGRYGDLSGKTVALEPATGFSFDSPMELRPH